MRIRDSRPVRRECRRDVQSRRRHHAARSAAQIRDVDRAASRFERHVDNRLSGPIEVRRQRAYRIRQRVGIRTVGVDDPDATVGDIRQSGRRHTAFAGDPLFAEIARTVDRKAPWRSIRRAWQRDHFTLQYLLRSDIVENDRRAAGDDCDLHDTVDPESRRGRVVDGGCARRHRHRGRLRQHDDAITEVEIAHHDRSQRIAGRTGNRHYIYAGSLTAFTINQSKTHTGLRPSECDPRNEREQQCTRRIATQ